MIQGDQVQRPAPLVVVQDEGLGGLSPQLTLYLALAAGALVLVLALRGMMKRRPA